MMSTEATFGFLFALLTFSLSYSTTAAVCFVTELTGS